MVSHAFRCTIVLLVLVTASSASAAAEPADPHIPKVPDGWKVELIARAPQLHYPTVVCAIPDGRVLVAEHPMDQTGPPNKPIDRILCIHPDGRITVWAENLYAVFGLQYLDGQVYVHQCPIFSVFDDEGDKAGARKDLIDTTWPQITKNGGLNDHIPAQFHLAMDGHFYMAFGDKGIYGAKSNIDGSAAEQRAGGILRFLPPAKELEIYSTGTRNHLDVAVNAEDEMFTYDNTDDGKGWWTRYTHMVDGGFYGYPWNYHPDDAAPEKVQEQIESGKPGQPYTLWRIEEYGGGSPCGAVSYNEDALPPEYHGNNFHCEWGKGALERFVVGRSGGSFRIVKREQIMTPGGDFRPIGICVTTDGLGFYVADWNLGGWNDPKDQGRLFKLTWTGKDHSTPKPAWFVAASMAKPFNATTDELVKALSHPAQSVRLVASRRLVERGDKAIRPLNHLLRNKTAPPHARWQAIWTLDKFDDTVARQSIDSVVGDDDDDVSVRRQAIRQVGMRTLKKGVPDGVPYDALVDEDASIRFQAATALGRIGSGQQTVYDLQIRLGVETDFFTQYAVFTALNRIGRRHPHLWPLIVKGFASDKPLTRERTAYAVRETYDEKLVQALATFVAGASNSAEGRAAALLALAPLHRQAKPWDGSWFGTQPVGGPPPKKELEWAGTAAVAAAIRNGIKNANPAVRVAAIDAVQLAPDPASGKMLADLFAADKDPAVRKSILRALAASKSADASTFVIEILNDPAANAQVIPEAIAVAERLATKQSSAALATLAGSDVSPDVQVLAIDAIGRLKDAAAVPTLARRAAHPEANVALAAVRALATMSGDEAARAKIAALQDARPDVRRAAAAGLETSPSLAAIEVLLAVAIDPEVQKQAVAALAATPDLRALDAYLIGLSDADATQREKCRTALAAISREALPVIEGRLDSNPLPTQVIAELQQVYTAFAPILSWDLVGPFPNPTEEPFATNGPPIGKDLNGIDGTPARWSKGTPEPKTGMLDLARIYNPRENTTAYAVTTIESAGPRPIEFSAGADDSITLWLNGERILEDLNDGGWAPNELATRGALKAGRNILVVKIGNHSGPWQVSVAMSGEGRGKLFEYDTAKLSPEAFTAFAMGNNGDAASGKQIFANVQGVACARCHAVDGQGGDVGPALTGIGAKYDKAKLIESILYPSKQIFDGYQQTLVRTKDGTVYAGSVRAETDTEFTLIDAEAKKTVIRKADVDRRKVSELSMMPEGLHVALKPEEFADLIEYLQSLKEPPAGTPSRD